VIRVRPALLVVAVAAVVLSAQPAAAANVGVVAQHNTASDFQSATTLDNLAVGGSGADGKITLSPPNTNPVTDQGDGSTDDTVPIIGDTRFNTTYQSELRVRPTQTLTVSQLTIDVVSNSGSLDTTVDIYIVQESAPDNTVGEGTLVKSGYSPTFADGEQTIQLDTSMQLDAGTNYIVEFVTQSSDNDGFADELLIRTDDSASSTWFGESAGGSLQERSKYADITLTQTASSAQYISGALTADEVEQAKVNISTLSNADATVTWQADDNSDGTYTNVTQTTVSSAQSVTSDLSAVASDTWRVRVDVSKTGSNPQFELESDALLAETNRPGGQDASPTGKIPQYDGEISLNVSDGDFGLSRGDSVDVSVADESGEIGSETVTSNGTVTLSYDAALEQNDLTWTLTDSYGNTQTVEQSFTPPSTLSVYYETDPDQLVNDTNATLEVRFFPIGEDGAGDVRSREISDGTVDLSGLPADERFIVTVSGNESQFTYRRIIVDSIFETQEIYLLRDSKPGSRVVFRLSDPTGQFPPEDTFLFVEKPITVDNSTEYRTIAGDNFGAAGGFPTILQTDARYRLRIVSGGDERMLGAYQVTGATVEELQVQQIQPAANDRLAGAVYGSLDDSGDLTVRFRGGDAAEVSYTIRDENGTVVVNETETDADRFAHVHPLNSSQEYNVSYTITGQNGESRSGSFTTGGVSGIATRLNVDAQILSLISWAVILMTMGLVVIVDAQLAPAAGTAAASGLMIIGTVAIPMPILGVAGAVSALTLFGGER